MARSLFLVGTSLLLCSNHRLKAVNIIVFFTFMIISVTAFSAPTDNQFKNAFQDIYYSSASSLCSAYLPARVVTGSCLQTYSAGVPNCAGSSAKGVKCKNTVTYSFPCTAGTVNNEDPTIHPFMCASPKVVVGSCPSFTCECPEGQVEENGTCVNQCKLPNVKNPLTKHCQLPCEAQKSPTGTLVGVSVSVDSADTCVAGCRVHHDLWQGKNANGYDASELLSYRTSDFCATGDASPPTVPPPKCDPPNVDTGTYCQPPPCPDWQERINGQCQDKKCPDGKTMKCGQINGEQYCSCSGLTDCPPGQKKDAFGNCLAVTCPANTPFNPATGKCEVKKEECPQGFSKVGLVCIKDTPGTKGPNDLDGDGIPNKDDDDIDGDGKPNATDGDKDGDGIPNDQDTTPAGPGTEKPIDPSTGPDDDYDGDGIPNKLDGDKDGDGIPNNRDPTPNGSAQNPPGGGQTPGTGTCDPAVQQCGNGAEKDDPGQPVDIGGSFYEKKGQEFPDVWDKFMKSVVGAPLVTAGSSFLSVSDVSGSCPTWTIPATFISESVEITLQCSEQVATAFRAAGVVFLIVCAWVAFRIALLD